MEEGEAYVCMVEEDCSRSDEIRATIVDHVINHGLSMRVQPNLQRSYQEFLKIA